MSRNSSDEHYLPFQHLYFDIPSHSRTEGSLTEHHFTVIHIIIIIIIIIIIFFFFCINRYAPLCWICELVTPRTYAWDQPIFDAITCNN